MADVAFEHVTKRFDGTTAVDDLSLEIADGEFMVLVGPSGCGKTTALRMLAGLEQTTEGKIVLGGGPTLSRGPSIHPDVFELLHDTAEAEGIPFVVEVSRGTTYTDADAVYLSRAGVATGLVSVPLRYMHSPIETIDLDDIEQAVRLIVAFALKLEPGLSFTG